MGAEDAIIAPVVLRVGSLGGVGAEITRLGTECNRATCATASRYTKVVKLCNGVE